MKLGERSDRHNTPILSRNDQNALTPSWGHLYCARGQLQEEVNTVGQGSREQDGEGGQEFGRALCGGVGLLHPSGI